MALRKKIQAALQQLAKVRLLRAGADQAHVALQDVKKLWQLIEPILANKSADARDAIVIVRGPAGAGLLGVLAHGTKFVDLEVLAVQSNTHLAKEHRPSAFDQDGQGNQRHHRRGQRDCEQSGGNIDGAFGCEQKSVLAETIREDQPAGRELFQRDAPADLFEDAVCVLNLDAGKFEPQQLAIRHAPALLLERQDHAVNLFFLDQRFQIADTANDSRVHQRLADVLAFFVQKAEHFQVEIGPGADFARERNAGRAGANHKDTLRPSEKEEAFGIEHNPPDKDERHDGGHGQRSNAASQAHAGRKVKDQRQADGSDTQRLQQANQQAGARLHDLHVIKVVVVKGKLTHEHHDKETPDGVSTRIFKVRRHEAQCGRKRQAHDDQQGLAPDQDQDLGRYLLAADFKHCLPWQWT